jgi:hypothetical protein
MAAPLEFHLKARREARFHVQVEVEKIPTEFVTPAEVPVGGRVVRVFRSDENLKVGDRVTFSVRVSRRG